MTTKFMSDQSDRNDQVLQRLSQLYEELHKPIVRLRDRLSEQDDRLKKQERLDILHWISTVPFRKHHSNMMRDILPGSGQWLLEGEKYQEWWNSSVSSILWLHGIPGCGKSRLIAQILHKHMEDL